MTANGTPICIEYRHGRPLSVITQNDGGSWTYYAIDWCRRNECLYYHWTGGGPARPVMQVGRFVGAPFLDPADRVKIWAPGIELRDGDETDLTVLGYERIAEPLGDPFEDAIEENAHYCELCDDYLPDVSDQLCQHLHTCGHCGDWVARSRRYVRPGHHELRLCEHLRRERRRQARRHGRGLKAQAVRIEDVDLA